jgi:hypothetical protein
VRRASRGQPPAAALLSTLDAGLGRGDLPPALRAALAAHVVALGAASLLVLVDAAGACQVLTVPVPGATS